MARLTPYTVSVLIRGRTAKIGMKTSGRRQARDSRQATLEVRAASVTKRRRPPKKPPKLQEIVTLIAQLGGYIPRKDSAPGTQTVWIGMQRRYDPALAWETFGPESKMKGS